MGTQVAERLRWAVEMLDVQPTDRVLEVGCGAGIAAELICQRLDGGRLVAIDRSASMMRLARQRNHAHEQSGTAVFYTVALKEARLDGEAFDKILAVNVNVFWQQPKRELEAIRRLLAPHGTLHLVYEPPSADKVDGIAALVQARLQANGFSVREVVFSDRTPVRAVGIIAEIPGGHSGRAGS